MNKTIPAVSERFGLFCMEQLTKGKENKENKENANKKTIMTLSRLFDERLRNVMMTPDIMLLLIDTQRRHERVYYLF